MRKYELIPDDGRKSFYGKAKVIEKDNGAMRYYHMIIEPKAGGTRKEYISTRQGEAP